MDSRFSTFVNRYVLTIFVVQILGWVVIAGLIDPSPRPAVAWVRTLPEFVQLLLLPLGMLSIPAIGISLGLEWALSLVGVSPESIPAILNARGDVLVFASAYALAVVGAWGLTRITGSK
ncbi:hypothetical protein C453_01665 [Haloferax elongans ATCC BAA-1513]|uniref:Uncharacterized protein n=1 Tax=Haloferax elongans ATCC BAA-1513 TaxID=1230453 RepID=M0HX15_HALEO|nr:hypothetical protein [Haloferax elongans]ELZ88247.1 hypothetical protein C453_01665 [Haloferax elongans ATCC BAA-1513]